MKIKEAQDIYLFSQKIVHKYVLREQRNVFQLLRATKFGTEWLFKEK